MRGRRRVGAALAAVTIWGLVACTPAPTPTPTGFTSEDEAFLAAESTYRAYVDAVNARREDSDSPVDPNSYLTGEALESSIRAQKRLDERGVRLRGTTTVHAVTGRSASGTRVTLEICVNSAETRVLDEHDNDVTPAEREDLGSLEVDFVWSSAEPLISGSRSGKHSC
jgi:hypothetical protein